MRFPVLFSSAKVNVSDEERAASTAIGGALLLLGLRRRSIAGAVMGIAGAELLYRGASGHCQLYQALDISTVQHKRRTGAAHAGAVEMQRSITIGKPANELYSFWRDPQNLARIMEPFAEVRAMDDGRQHWRMRGPRGAHLEWDAQVVEEDPGKHLRWKSLPGAELSNEGSVQFRPAPGGRGTEVQLRLRFTAPGGALDKAVARKLGVAARALAFKALNRFKSLAETGEVASLERNPSARSHAA